MDKPIINRMSSPATKRKGHVGVHSQISITRYPEVSRCSFGHFGHAKDRKGIQWERPRYIVPLAVNKTKQCTETVHGRVLAVCSAESHRVNACVCANTALVCARARDLLRLYAREKARAFICLLAGPGINNAAIRYKNEKKGW